jgi:alpha-tubulin suppressor-like RCC1 family protein
LTILLTNSRRHQFHFIGFMRLSTSYPKHCSFWSGKLFVVHHAPGLRAQGELFKKPSTFPSSSTKELRFGKVKESCHLATIMTVFVDVAEGTRHSIGVTENGKAYSWGRSSKLGQLGRDTSATSSGKPGPIPLPEGVVVKKAYVSDSEIDSGHSALLDDHGRLWMTGCDRWQQLGLGSAKGGSAGYTWKGGKLWQERFVLSPFVNDLMKEDDADATIRDVSLGADHTLVLSSNLKDVYAFGKGGDGQLGFVGKPFVSAPRKSSALSEPGISAVCAVQNCSITLGSDGRVKQRVGRQCGATAIQDGINKCIEQAKRHGLLNDR